MTNAVYQTTVEELEALISPRVVSRALQEGLRLVGKTPETITVDDVDKILKEQVFRQLQVTMAVTEAKLKITQIIERLRTVGSQSASSQHTLAQQEETLLNLQESLKPFNLYFEWPEVQKLRAQLKLLETEHEAGREASRLIQDARQQLRVIEQKQEDQLVNQARILTDLEASLDDVKTLGGPKVRRLENLMGQVQEAQERRQLATAESERALKLLADLRKLLESSVFTEPAEPGQGNTDAVSQTANQTVNQAVNQGVKQTEPSPEALNPVINERLKQIDLDSERHSLEKLANDHANLLVYNKDLAETVIRSRSLLDAQTSIAEMLELLPERFQEATLEQRQVLQAEIGQLQEATNEFGDVDLSDFEQRVQILTGMLETSLPSPRDMQHLRSLFQLAQTRYAEAHAQKASEEAARKEALSQQSKAVEALEASLKEHEDSLDLMAELGSLQTALAALKQDHEAGYVNSGALDEARQAETQLLNAVLEQAKAGQEREQAQLRSLLSEFQSLPVESELQERAHTFAEKLSLQLNEDTNPEAITSLQADLETYKKDLRDIYHLKLEKLTKRAEDLEASSLVSYLSSVAAEVTQDVYPNIDDIENSLRTALETRQREQLDDIRVWEEELEAYVGSDTAGVSGLVQGLADARAQLEGGELAQNLPDIGARIAALNTDLERRAADFVPRLDAALESYGRVHKLNSDEVTEVGLTLKHLDAQREALERVSTGVKNELEASLQKAEAMLLALEQQFEATQAVADQLAGGSALDGLFDLFGDDSGGLFGDDDQLALDDVPKQEDTVQKES